VPADEEAVLVALQREIAAVDDQLGALLDARSTRPRIFPLRLGVTTGPKSTSSPAV
jgi:hypothetical protein